MHGIHKYYKCNILKIKLCITLSNDIFMSMEQFINLERRNNQYVYIKKKHSELQNIVSVKKIINHYGISMQNKNNNA